MQNLIELEITTTPQDERDQTVLATIELDSYLAEATIREGRLCVVLGAPEKHARGWCIDCGPVEPRLRS